MHYLTHQAGDTRNIIDTDKRRKRAQDEATKALELRRKDPLLRMSPKVVIDKLSGCEISLDIRSYIATTDNAKSRCPRCCRCRR